MPGASIWVSTMIASCASRVARSDAALPARTGSDAARARARTSGWRRVMQVSEAGSDESLSAGAHRAHQRAAQPVAQLGGAMDVPEHEVGAQARAQHSAVVQAERARGVHGGAAQRLL